MNHAQYTQAIKEFCIYPDAFTCSDVELCYLTLGLASEAGEVAGLMKKEIRDQPEAMDSRWIAEFGDVLWYLTRLMDEFGFTLEDVMNYNYKKLSERKKKQTLTGSGDFR